MDSDSQRAAQDSPGPSSRPKRGDRFIHRHFIREGVTAAQVLADPENEEFYAVRVVTSVRNGRVYHADCAGGISSWFLLSTQGRYVRRWLSLHERTSHG